VAGAMVPANPSNQIERYDLPVELESTRRIARLFVFSVLKWRRAIMVVFLLVTAGISLIVLLQPPVRSAYARVLIRGGRTAYQVPGLAYQGGRGVDAEVLRSEIQMITSRDVFDIVARMFLKDEGALTAPVSDEMVERLADSLRRRTTANAISESGVIQVRHDAPTSGEALKALRMIIDKYLEVRAFTDSGAAKLVTFYSRELDKAEDDLRASEERLTEWRRQNNLASVESELAKKLPALAEGERALQQTNAEIDATRARIAFLRARVEPEQERIVLNQERVRNPLVTTLRSDLAAVMNRPADEPEPHVAKLKGELLTAELAVRNALQRYTDQDRTVQEKREQVEYLRRELESARRDSQLRVEQTVGRLREELAEAEAAGDVVARETVALNPLREDLRRELASAEALGQSLESRREAHAVQVRTLSGVIAALAGKKLEEERRDRLVKASVEQVTQNTRRLDDARVAAGLEQEQLAAVSVIEAPYVELDTEGNRRLGIVLGAGILGLMLGAGMAFGVESLRDRCRTVEEVEYYLGVPVLAAVPEDGKYVLDVPSPSALPDSGEEPIRRGDSRRGSVGSENRRGEGSTWA
jgi:uncharacterized protein involved in exopolysaccharide biosynthesis